MVDREEQDPQAVRVFNQNERNDYVQKAKNCLIYCFVLLGLTQLLRLGDREWIDGFRHLAWTFAVFYTLIGFVCFKRTLPRHDDDSLVVGYLVLLLIWMVILGNLLLPQLCDKIRP